ncbi:MAG: transcriptional regulator, partial [Candidatus Eisenbacteria bacterium]|nr:transcriptional regulator [Candidatus Eisenbacteria bacterium]
DLALKAPKPVGREYPTELRTIGDHVRKRRLDLGLSQQDLAKILRVTVSTVSYWETKRANPSIRSLSRVLRFLGYDPRPQAKAFPELIRQLRQGLGLSQEGLAEKIGVDPSTVRKWEKLGYHPRPQLYARLAKILRIPDPPEDSPIGERIRARRLKLGMTQAEASAQIGVSQDTLSRWELGGNHPQGEDIQKTSRILKFQI